MDGVGAADQIGAGFGKPEVFDLAFLNQILDGSGDIFDGNVFATYCSQNSWSI